MLLDALRKDTLRQKLHRGLEFWKCPRLTDLFLTQDMIPALFNLPKTFGLGPRTEYFCDKLTLIKLMYRPS